MQCAPASVLVTFLLIQVILAADSLRPRHKRLTNANAARWKKFNFAAAILLPVLKNWRLQCGGSLISPNRVLTSAHCFSKSYAKGPIHPENVRVLLGRKIFTLVNSSSELLRVTKIVIHEDFKYVLSDSDIALIFLKDNVAVDNTNIGIANIRRSKVPDWSICQAAGWGVTEHGTISTQLKEGNFVIISEILCLESFAVISDKIICAISPQYSTVCSGDSGGPLICDNKLVGIVDSSGINCSRGSPSFFTSVSYFSDWIDGNQSSPASNLVKLRFIVSLGSLIVAYLLSI